MSNPGPISPKRALITGGGTGIGRALALLLVARGDRVLVCGRRAEPLEALKREQPAIEILSCDIAEASGRTHLVDAVHTRLGALDLLFNNAGLQLAQEYGSGKLRAEEVEREIAVNLTAPMLLCDRLLPLLLKSADPAIVNVISLLALIPVPRVPGYCATKAGLLNFSGALRMQLASTPVRVIEFFPPFVDTPMTAGRGANKMSAEECGKQLLQGLATGHSRIAVGQAATLLFVHRFFPSLATHMMWRISRPSRAR